MNFINKPANTYHLVIDGCKILRFAYDDVKDKPRMCEQMLQQFMGRYFEEITEKTAGMNYVEKEVLRFLQSR
ncbi:hypothetical protein ICC18_26575 [Paenibacillus sp. WST5]|uniref:Uncharacterized protein n=1 Tax=Paenibacillus sedimenti TaxID=2770274 RepID=A0A926KU95_9BACL|nr:hypothetical protein [Paenibacillus sedimenti]